MNLKCILSGIIALLCMSASGLAQIQAGRAVQITISGVPAEEKQRFDAVYPVSESGTINMPYIGAVPAAGMKSAQLATSLQNRYKKAGIYSHPTIQVIDSSAKSIDEQVVYVGGQVRRTGPVRYDQKLTIYQAIQAAGGATEFGSMKRVKLFRGGRQKRYDLTKSQFMHIPLEPNDTIEVPQKNWIGG